MTQQELIEALTLYGEKDCLDYIIISVNIISPIIMLISVIIAWRATKISKTATELNLKMYKEQMEKEAKSYLPNFEITKMFIGPDTIKFRLINSNDKLISITNVATQESITNFQKQRIGEKVVLMQFNGSFQSEESLKFWLYYTTQNHQFYCSELTLFVSHNSIVIEEHKITDKSYRSTSQLEDTE